MSINNDSWTTMRNKYEEEQAELSRLATSQQRFAANPNMSIWVEASAGTGKTKVLSDRVLRLLLAKVNPAKILCLTYTKAAAVEMNERIAKRLSTWAVADDTILIGELQNLLGEDFNKQNPKDLLNFARTLFALLLDTPGGMKIQTIHSFCQDVLKRFPLEAGVSPYFEVLDDRVAKEILQNIKIDLLRSADMDNNGILSQSVTFLTKNLSELQFPGVMNMITENRSKIANLLKKYDGDISAIIRVLENNLGVKSNLSEDDIKRNILSGIDMFKLKEAVEDLNQGTKTDIESANVFLKVLENNEDISLYNGYRMVFLKADGTIRQNLTTKGIASKYPETLKFLQQEAERILSQDNAFAALRVLKATIAILYIAKNIIEQYNAYKAVYAALDYEDLIVITRRLLENREVADWVLFKLDGGIDHILIDEAQDTSPDQWAIIRALTQEFFAGYGSYEEALPRTVFVVGDRKQSIYSFQGADPREFDKMYHYFEEKIQKFSKIHLDVSFRSTKAIMDCVNTLFEVKEAKKGVVPLNEHINHQPYRLGDGGRVEIFPLSSEENATTENLYSWTVPLTREQKASPSNILARQIAQNIKDMVEKGEILASKNRPIRYGDFMFLVQQRNAFVEEFIRACKEKGVNIAGIDKLKLLEQIAVQDLISLSNFLLLPDDDLSLAEVLKSPIFGLSDDDLFDLCYKRESSLFVSILKNSQYAQIADQLKTLLNMTGFVRPFELFSYILIKMNARKNFISRMGREVDDVLDEFLNLAITFEQTHTPSLESFVAWIGQDEVIIKKEMEQGDSDTVKIMTVHGSKGLQAPIVILADTTKVKNKAMKIDFLWKDSLLYFPMNANSYDNVCKSIKETNLDADFDEYRRLLYVALTRAEDRLYIAGFSKKKVNDESWYNLLSTHLKSNIPLPPEDKRIVYNIEQEKNVDAIQEQRQPELHLSSFENLLTPAPIENPLAKPYAPSRDESDEVDIVASPLKENGDFYRRGTIIHKLLQYIATISINKRQQAAETFLKTQLPHATIKDINRIVNEVFKLYQTYPDIFGANSKAEVPIIGEIDGKIVSAKIDRLVINNEKVIIVDYKTNRPAASCLEEVPEVYLHQLNTYKALLKKIYPHKMIETYILWTNTCNMMKL
mgnify:CR=1 FL=1